MNVSLCIYLFSPFHIFLDPAILLLLTAAAFPPEAVVHMDDTALLGPSMELHHLYEGLVAVAYQPGAVCANGGQSKKRAERRGQRQ